MCWQSPRQTQHSPDRGGQACSPAALGSHGLSLLRGSRLQEGEESLLFGVLEHSAGVVPGCGRAPGLAVHEYG